MITELNSATLYQMDEIGKSFAEEAQYPGGWSYPAFSKTWNLFLDAELGKIFVARENDGVVGALGAVFVPDPYSGQVTAVEQFWFVLPSHRKTRVGMELFQAFREEAQKRQAKKMVMVHLAALTPESLQKFYEKEGFRLAEQIFWKEI